MSESIRRKHSQPQFASSPLLPDEQVLWEGDARRMFEQTWIIFGIITAIFIYISIGLHPSFWLFIILYGVFLIVPIIILLVELVITPKYHYRLTSKEMIIVKRGFSEETTISFKFSLLLAVELKERGFLPHIRLVSPDGDIPSRLYPPKKALRDLYEALIPLWQTSLLEADAAERLKLQRLYNPPWKPWVSFSILITVIALSCYFIMELPHIFNWRGGWNVLFGIIGWGLFVVLIIGDIFSPLFLGKEFRFFGTRVSPKHRWTMASALLIPFVPIIIFSLR